MAQKQLKLTVALKDGVITNVEDVQSGIKCGCVCPACGEPLVAKKVQIGYIILRTPQIIIANRLPEREHNESP